MKTNRGSDTAKRVSSGRRIQFRRWRGQPVAYKNVLASELIDILRTACRESITAEGSARTRLVSIPVGKSVSYDLGLAKPFLMERGFANHICMHRPRGKDLLQHPDRSEYALNNVIIRHLTIKLDQPFVGRSSAGWEIMNWALKLHIEHCRFIPTSPNSATIEFPWCGRFRFYRNDFAFSGRGGRGWLLVFGSGSDVALQRNRFLESDIDLISLPESADSRIEELSWEGHNAYLLRDENFFKEMIRRTHRLPQSARLTTVDSHYSTPHVGLWRVTLVANTGIRRILMRCSAKHYAFRGRNHVQSLHFDESRADRRDLIVYLGPRERIDPDFLSSLHHRELFLWLRGLADGRGDASLVGRLDRHLDRIEYFLTKQYGASVHDGVSAWTEYWQDRVRHGWRRWSSDFYASWMRPLVLGVFGYVAFNALAWFWIETFTVSDWIAFCLRRIDRIPFYTAGLKDLYPVDYASLSSANKNWLRCVGLLQNIWIAMWGFAFSKAVRR